MEVSRFGHLRRNSGGQEDAGQTHLIAVTQTKRAFAELEIAPARQGTQERLIKLMMSPLKDKIN
jgi:hypothetical protein